MAFHSLRQNRRVDTTTIQITVDNQSPEVSIPYPVNEQQFQFESGEFITLQAEAYDNIGLESVTFYMDNNELVSQTQSPYAVPWRLSVGEHVLRVEAIDFAGNSSESSITITVNE